MKIYGSKIGIKGYNDCYRNLGSSYLRTNPTQRKIIAELYPELKKCKTLFTTVPAKDYVEVDIDLNKVNKVIRNYNI